MREISLMLIYFFFNIYFKLIYVHYIYNYINEVVMKILDPQKLSSVNGGVGFIACCAGIGAALTVMHFLTRRRVQSSFDDAINTK